MIVGVPRESFSGEKRVALVPASLPALAKEAYVFPNAAVRALLRNPTVINHRHRGPRHGKCNVDSVVGRWCREAGLAYYMHAPSLAQHTGDSSTLWSHAKAAGRRCASSFPGGIIQIIFE